LTKNLFADVSSHNPASAGYFQALKNAGCKGVVIKLTEGTYYTNPSASAQIANTKSHGMKVSVYHFARFTSVAGAKSEANFFLKSIKAHGISTDAVVVNDFEATHASTAALNAFYEPLEAAGYKNISIYSMSSWFNAGYFNGVRGLKWVAQYGSSSCSVKCDAWQYTSTAYFSGSATDLSWDYNGAFTTAGSGGSGGNHSQSNSDRENNHQQGQADATKKAYCYSLMNMLIMNQLFDKWLH
jgi:GH25 family lysozyme M1 (1,4-beta-N-acetylmuramidase)